LPHFNIIFITCALLWSTLSILLSIATGGYETRPLTSTSYNSATKLWYEKVFPENGWFPKSWTCAGSIIKPLESWHSLTVANGCYHLYRNLLLSTG
jgi:hypothetical protein